jgi:hypothetical protein
MSLNPNPRDDDRPSPFDVRSAPLNKLVGCWKSYQHATRMGYIDTFHRTVVDEIVDRLEALQL